MSKYTQSFNSRDFNEELFITEIERYLQNINDTNEIWEIHNVANNYIDGIIKALNKCKPFKKITDHKINRSPWFSRNIRQLLKERDRQNSNQFE